MQVQIRRVRHGIYHSEERYPDAAGGLRHVHAGRKSLHRRCYRADPAHIRENFALFDFTLIAEEMAQLSALYRKAPLIGNPETPELVEFSLTW